MRLYKPSVKLIRAHFSYDPETGDLWWKIVYNKRPKDQPAGWMNGKYRWVKFFGKNYPASHIIWVIQKGYWPKHQIDHRDLDPSNNTWNNLREATNQQNMCNKKARSDNKSGYKGVSWRKPNKKWCAQICVKGTVLHLGLFKTAEQAHKAYTKAAKKYFGKFARSS